MILNIIKEELTEIKEKFADKRRTEIKPNLDEIDIEELIKEEDVVITLTKQRLYKKNSVRYLQGSKQRRKKELALQQKKMTMLTVCLLLQLTMKYYSLPTRKVL